MTADEAKHYALFQEAAARLGAIADGLAVSPLGAFDAATLFMAIGLSKMPLATADCVAYLRDLANSVEAAGSVPPVRAN